jgi:Na+/proline symporter
MISPGMHAAIDWGTAAAFLTVGALLWRKNKRAALAAMISGELIGSLIFLTDCPGGVWKKISFETHGKIDPGVSALVASMPNLLGFSDEQESKLFQSIGIGLAAVRSLTAFEEGSSNAETRMTAA